MDCIIFVIQCQEIFWVYVLFLIG